MKRRWFLGFIAALAVLAIAVPHAEADKLCVKKSSKVSKTKVSNATLFRVASTCPSGYLEVLDTSSFRGPAGAAGPQGADGQLRIYGDGSAGAKTISSSQSLGSDDRNLQFTDFTVAAGQTLTVPSGAIIRCTGTFTNNGTINISTGAETASAGGTATGVILLPFQLPLAGVSKMAPSYPEVGDDQAARVGGFGGAGLSAFEAAQIRYPGTVAGGGGGLPYVSTTTASCGPAGGGSLVVLCQQGIVNNGTISANGASGGGGGCVGGGGAGGVLLLASPGSVVNAGGAHLNAKGGAGSASDSDEGYGASGGGGGGIVHLIAPLVTNSGAVDVSGGAAGTGGSVLQSPRSGGAGGGACGGDGGAGGQVEAGPGNSASAASAGADGHALTTQTDPTALF